MDFKLFFEEEFFVEDTSLVESLKKVLKDDNKIRHDVTRQHRAIYVDQLSDFFIDKFKESREEFLKIINSSVLTKFGLKKKKKGISEVVIDFLKNDKFAKFVLMQFPELKKIVDDYKKHDEYIRKEVMGREFELAGQI